MSRRPPPPATRSRTRSSTSRLGSVCPPTLPISALMTLMVTRISPPSPGRLYGLPSPPYYPPVRKLPIVQKDIVSVWSNSVESRPDRALRAPGGGRLLRAEALGIGLVDQKAGAGTTTRA